MHGSVDYRYGISRVNPPSPPRGRLRRTRVDTVPGLYLRSFDGAVAYLRQSLAHSTTFLSQTASATGPTPPGTGVIAPATGDAASKSTSPQSFPSGVRLMPMSKMIAPGF